MKITYFLVFLQVTAWKTPRAYKLLLKLLLCLIFLGILIYKYHLDCDNYCTYQKQFAL